MPLVGQRFEAKPIAADVPSSHCDWWIGSDWPTFVAPLRCRIDAKHSKLSEQRLRHEIVFALAKSPTGKRMSRILAGLD